MIISFGDRMHLSKQNPCAPYAFFFFSSVMDAYACLDVNLTPSAANNDRQLTPLLVELKIAIHPDAWIEVQLPPTAATIVLIENIIIQSHPK